MSIHAPILHPDTKLKLTAHTGSRMWYSKYDIGTLLPYAGESSGPEYWSREDEGYLNFIWKSDAEIVIDSAPLYGPATPAPGSQQV